MPTRGYIGWGEFVANRKRLTDNLARRAAKRPGVPREGRAAARDRRVRPLRPAYGAALPGRPAATSVYRCTADQAREGRPRCQEVRAPLVDAEAEHAMLAASPPTASPWRSRRWASWRRPGCWSGAVVAQARARPLRGGAGAPAVRRSSRRIGLRGPRERAWRAAAARGAGGAGPRAVAKGATAGADRGGPGEDPGARRDLPRVWHAATAAERKRLLRLVVKEVVLDQGRERGGVWMRIVWQTERPPSTGCNGTCGLRRACRPGAA